jgi:glycosyltransferase involved in cell wall biosynthesis
MKCLLVTNIFPPAIGGPATFMDLLAHKLLNLGHEVSVVCSSEGDVAPLPRPFPVYRANLAKRYSYEIKIRALLLAQLAQHSHILINGLESYAFPICRLLGRKPILKIVGDSAWERARNLGVTTLSIDEFQSRETQKDAFIVPIVRSRQQQLSIATKIVTPSDYLKKMVEGWGVAAEKIVVINNAVDIAELPKPASIEQSDALLRLIFVGRLTNWKGLETVLLALTRTPKVELVVCGDGPELPLLAGLAKQLDLSERVRFLGRQSRSSVLSWLQIADVAVLPSLYEGLSHTLLDALALGLPVIASSCGGNVEMVVDSTTGYLVRPQNPAALAGAILKLRDDPQLRSRMAQATKEQSKRYSLEKMVNSYAELLSNQR